MSTNVIIEHKKVISKNMVTKILLVKNSESTFNLLLNITKQTIKRLENKKIVTTTIFLKEKRLRV